MDQIVNLLKLSTALYGRTSKDDPRRITIVNQQNRLREWAAEDPQVDKAELQEFWDEGVSGVIPMSERPAGQKLLASVRSGEIKCVAVAYADRWGRTLLDGLKAVEELILAGCFLVSVNEGWDARRHDSPMWFQLRLLMAEEEWRRIKERTEKGKLRAIERDNAPPGGPLVFGYRVDEHGHFVIWPEQAEIVIEVYRRYLQGESITSIASRLNDAGVEAGRRFQKRTPGSTPILRRRNEISRVYPTKVRYILTNRTYIGERKWGKKMFQCTPIISRDIFDRVQQKLREHCDGRTQMRSNPEQGLLSGLLTCGECGKKLYVMTNKHKYRDKIYRYRRYVCSGCYTGSNCGCRTLLQKDIDMRIWETVECYLREPQKLLNQYVKSTYAVNQDEAEISAAQEKYSSLIARIEKKISEIWHEQQQRDLPLSYVWPQLEALQKQQREAQAELKAARESASKLIQDQGKIEELQTNLITIRQRLAEGLTATEKRHIVELLLAKAIVQTEGSGRKKTAAVHLQLRCGGLLTPELAKD